MEDYLGSGMDGSEEELPDFELPEIDLMPRNDARFADYVSDSIISLDEMCESWEQQIESIENGFEQVIELPGMPFLQRDDALRVLNEQLGQIACRAGQFMQEALLFTRARTIHKNGHPSKFVHLFVDMGDGSCGYARFDTELKTADYEPDKYASINSLLEKEWILSLPEEFARQPFYLVTCQVGGVDFAGLASRAGIMADAYMASVFPEFYREKMLEVPCFKSSGLKLIVEPDPKSDDLTLYLALDGNGMDSGSKWPGIRYLPA